MSVSHKFLLPILLLSVCFCISTTASAANEGSSSLDATAATDLLTRGTIHTAPLLSGFLSKSSDLAERSHPVVVASTRHALLEVAHVDPTQYFEFFYAPCGQPGRNLTHTVSVFDIYSGGFGESKLAVAYQVWEWSSGVETNLLCENSGNTSPTCSFSAADLSRVHIIAKAPGFGVTMTANVWTDDSTGMSDKERMLLIASQLRALVGDQASTKFNEFVPVHINANQSPHFPPANPDYSWALVPFPSTRDIVHAPFFEMLTQFVDVKFNMCYFSGASAKTTITVFGVSSTDVTTCIICRDDGSPCNWNDGVALLNDYISASVHTFSEWLFSSGSQYILRCGGNVQIPSIGKTTAEFTVGASVSSYPF
jgi:hypothetical protein